jgi:hypothetical protein
VNYDSTDDTRDHIFQVAARLEAVGRELRHRGQRHDASKLGTYEKPLFDAVGPNLKGLVYGSDDYREAVKELAPALKHHYANNSHHPEHYENGIAGMDLLDLIEMYCDWAASTLRTKDGDMSKSLEINITRFRIDGPLGDILRNTWKRHGGFSGQPESNAPIDRLKR